ncbi:MAG: AbgT family transporter [Bacteroidaceae bacterium]|nr:AbgT family transporter [Bacteroidaceae bacterium]MBQ9642298.1 AbgT family transporter [Bacteroidaceae bacterium]
MTKLLLKWLLLLELLAFPLIAISSWVVSIYNSGANNLLAPNGLRWLLTSFVSNFARLPWAEILLGLIALSVLQFSGIADCVVHRPTQKQQRALLFALAALVSMVVAVGALTVLPPYILLNFFGGTAQSPLTDSLPGLLFITAEVVACVYGYTSGKMVTIEDFSVAHSQLIVQLSPLFIHAFLLSQVFEWIKYSYFL